MQVRKMGEEWVMEMRGEREMRERWGEREKMVRVDVSDGQSG